MKKTILVVDDEKVIIKRLKSLLQERGYNVLSATSAEEISNFYDLEIDLILLDLNLPDADGIELIPELKEKFPLTQIIMVSGYGEIKDAVNAIKEGAFDFLEKPINRERLFIVIKNAIEKKELLEKKNLLEKGIVPPIVGLSAHIKKLKTFINKIADINSPLLITGETGTGKDLMVKHIHLKSKRRNYKLVMINCAAIPSELLESELFGYKKGAFSGAVKDKKGKIEEADRGILFFNEIGEMSTLLQAKLLTFMEEKSFERLGDTKSIKVDTRIIAATNQNLEKAIKEQKFREDLFFRLNTFSFEILPLRKRQEDIIPLIEHFSYIYAAEFGTIPVQFTEDAKDFLINYPWHGNVRELKHFIEKITVMERKKLLNLNSVKKYLLKYEDVSLTSLKNARKKFEKDYIERVIRQTKSLKKACEVLELSRMQLYRKIKEYEIEFEE